MSKSYHFNDPYQHKKHNVRDIKFANKFNVNYYLLRFEDIISFKRYNKKRDINNVLFMLDEGYPHFGDTNFTKERFLRFVHNLLVLYNQCPTFAENFTHYIKETPQFSAALFKCTFENMSYYAPNEIFYWFRKFACLGINISAAHKQDFYDSSLPYLAICQSEDLYKILESIVLLDDAPPFNWQNNFVETCKQHVVEMDAHQLFYIIHHLDTFDAKLVEEFKAYLSLDGQKVISELPCQQQTACDEVKNREVKEKPMLPNKHTKDWFASSGVQMPSTTPFLVVKNLLHLTYEQIEIPNHWMQMLIKKISEEFCLMTGGDIIRALYAFSLRCYNPWYLRVFLEKCSAYFENHPNYASNYTEENRLRKIILIDKYFGGYGYNLNFHYDHVLEDFKKEALNHANSSFTQKVVGDYLHKIFVNQSIYSEHYIDCVADVVDFYVPSKNLVVEVDGEFHTNNGKKNAITQLKTFLLKKHGYLLERIEVSTVQIGKIAYVNERLKRYNL